MEYRINPFASGNINKKRKVVLVAPEKFALFSFDHRHALLSFIKHIRTAIKKKIPIHIDFSQVKELHPCGTLLFAAELFRINNNLKLSSVLSCNYPKELVVEQMFQHIGLLELFNKNERTKITFDNVVHWSFHKGHSLEELKELSSIKENFTDPLGHELSHRLLSGISEAIINCFHHAYIEKRNDEINLPSESGWWLFTQQKDGLISVSICDLGIGIPRSLPKSQLYTVDELQERLAVIGLGSSKDSNYIKAAIDHGITRTGQGHRGKGLSEIINVVKRANKGGIRIFSNKGAYNYNSATDSEKYIEDDRSIMGTIIQWTFPVDQLEGASQNE